MLKRAQCAKANQLGVPPEVAKLTTFSPLESFLASTMWTVRRRSCTVLQYFRYLHLTIDALRSPIESRCFEHRSECLHHSAGAQFLLRCCFFGRRSRLRNIFFAHQPSCIQPIISMLRHSGLLRLRLALGLGRHGSRTETLAFPTRTDKNNLLLRYSSTCGRDMM